MNLIPFSIFRVCFLIAVAAALSSCVSFSNGLVENPLPVDGRLIGYWERINKKEKLRLLIEADGPSAITVTGFDDAGCTTPPRFSAARTEIAGHDFLDIAEVTNDGKHPWWNTVGYEFSDSNRLAVFLPDQKIFEQAVAVGELSGKVSTRKGFTFVNIDSSAADLRQWIAAHPTAVNVLFLQFERRDSSSAPQCDGGR